MHINNMYIYKYFLRVIPTQIHYSDLVSDIPSGSHFILFGIYSDILYGTLSGIKFDIPSSIYSDIISGILAYLLTFFLAFYLVHLRRFFVVEARRGTLRSTAFAFKGTLCSRACCSGSAGNMAI